jgi:hypothetical protein
VPGSPSQEGSKPGDALPSQSTKQLVASRGRGGSNPPPGAINIVLDELPGVGYCGFLKIFAFSKSRTYWNPPPISLHASSSVQVTFEMQSCSLRFAARATGCNKSWVLRFCGQAFA